MPAEKEMENKSRLARASNDRPKPGIVHLGPGAFFRAFNAVYTDDVLNALGGDWGIIAVGLRSPTTRDQLVAQDCLYHAIELNEGGKSLRLIKSITDVLVASESLETVLDTMSDPAIRIVSMTVTEKGYCHHPSTGKLQLDNPDIVHDLSNPTQPVSVPGIIVEALARRKEKQIAPFTVLSCDNLPENGKLTQGIVLEYASAREPALARWIEQKGKFPSTMVDRITPATTAEDRAFIAQKLGATDLGCVVHEPFRQWVIEDDFVDGVRPDWSVGGAQFVSDVAAHEAMKLRCLNGAHSSIAYLGYLAGFETISETVSDAAFEAFCSKLWQEEIVPTIAQPEGEDLDQYCGALLARFKNPGIRHLNWQIAMDGSQKLPQRLLGTISDNLDAGRDIKGLVLAVAGWMRYVGGVDEKGGAIDVRDPLSKELHAASKSGETPKESVLALLEFDQIFPRSLVSNAIFVSAVAAAYEGLERIGAHAMIKEYVDA